MRKVRDYDAELKALGDKARTSLRVADAAGAVDCAFSARVDDITHCIGSPIKASVWLLPQRSTARRSVATFRCSVEISSFGAQTAKEQRHRTTVSRAPSMARSASNAVLMRLFVIGAVKARSPV